MNYFNNRERPQTYFKSQLLGNFIRDMEDTGIATLPIFHLPDGANSLIEKPDENAKSDAADSIGTGSSTEQEANSTGYDISGAAIIKDYKLVEYVDKEVVRGQLIVDGDVKNAPVVIEYNGSPLTYILQRASSRKKFMLVDGQMSLVIELDVDGDIAEYVSDGVNNIFNERSMEDIKRLLEGEVMRQAFVAIDKSRELNVDFMHIGQAMYRKDPDLWENYETTWNTNGFQNFPIWLNVEVNIDNTGIIQ